MTEMETKVWYCRRGDNKRGPYTDDELIRLIEKEILEPTDEIWMMDMQDWMAIKDTIYSYYLTDPSKT